MRIIHTIEITLSVEEYNSASDMAGIDRLIVEETARCLVTKEFVIERFGINLKNVIPSFRGFRGSYDFGSSKMPTITLAFLQDSTVEVESNSVNTPVSISDAFLTVGAKWFVKLPNATSCVLATIKARSAKTVELSWCYMGADSHAIYAIADINFVEQVVDTAGG